LIFIKKKLTRLTLLLRDVDLSGAAPCAIKAFDCTCYIAASALL